MSKHTPGPWEINWYICKEGGKELWRAPAEIGPISPEHNHWGGWLLSVDEADARLIAAAPDLLKACAATLAGYPGWQKMIQNAHDKATGG